MNSKQFSSSQWSAESWEPLFERIPDDVLREIFLSCLPEGRRYISTSSKECPVLLTHVCSHWRRVAVDFNLLWQSIGIHLPEAPVDQELIQRLANVFKRSKDAQLNLQIILPYDMGFELYADPLFAHLLLPTSRTLTQLTLLRVRPCQLALLSPGLFPSLENLVLFYERRLAFDQAWDEDEMISAFQDAMALRYLAVKGLEMLGEDKGIPSLAFPAHTLTHFILGTSRGQRVASNFVFKCLPQCRNIQSLGLVVKDEDWVFGVGYNPPSLELRSIRALKLQCHSDVIRDLLDRIDFPNLEILRLEGGYLDMGPWTPIQTRRFLTKLTRFAHLEYLSLQCGDCTAMESIFESVSHTKTLHIGSRSLKKLFVMLAQSNDSMRLLPRLDTLVLYIKGDNSEPIQWISYFDTAFFKLMRLRVPNGLRKLVLCGFTFHGERDRIDRLVKFGLRGYINKDQLIVETHFHGEVPECDPAMYDWREAEPIVSGRVSDYCR